ncbi:MAG: phosphotransferase system glucose/maltose/N-acetylglucosamine-specific IIC component, partial [Oleiphilaceae bacterium]
MISEIFGEDVSTFVVFFFIAWWIKYILIDTPKAEKEIKEQKIKENKQKEMKVENALQVEQNLIKKAN